jgi:hypothetical protein
VPSDRTVTLRLEGYREPSGTAWFDDVSVQEQSPRPLEVFLLYPNFRGMLFDDETGGVRLDVSVSLAEAALAGHKVIARLVEEGTGQVAASAEYPASSHLVAALDGCAMRAGASYLAQVSLVPSSGGAAVYEYPPYRVSRVSAAARAAMKVSFDQRNRVLVRGRPRFVLGVYDSGMGYGTTDAFWEQQLFAPDGARRLAGLPITFYLNYHYGEAPFEAVSSLMTTLERHGIQYLQTANCHIGRPLGPSFAAHSDGYVQGLAAHPALAGYYTADECDNTLVPVVFDQYQRLKALDPGSITFGALLGRADLALWRDAVDVLSTDPYPLFGAEPAGGYRHSLVGDEAALTREAVKDARPFFTVLQFFRFTSRGRFPTRAEMRNHALMAITEGARGLFWWSLGANALAHVCGSSAAWCEQRLAHMEDLRVVISEIAALEPALLGNDVRDAVTSTASPNIRTRVKEASGRRHLFAYNHENTTETVRFQVNGPVSRVSVAGEDRVLDVSGGGFSDSFSPFEAHVYVIE